MEKKDQIIAAAITATEKEALEKIAKKEDRTLSYVVGQAIKDFIKLKQI